MTHASAFEAVEFASQGAVLLYDHHGFGASGGEPRLEIEGGHLGLLWHLGALFDRAVGAQRDFLLRVLAPPGSA